MRQLHSESRGGKDSVKVGQLKTDICSLKAMSPTPHLRSFKAKIMRFTQHLETSLFRKAPKAVGEACLAIKSGCLKHVSDISSGMTPTSQILVLCGVQMCVHVGLVEVLQLGLVWR